MTDTNLPDQPVTFKRPPVTEVAFGVQFRSPIIDLEVLGGIAARAKPGFPLREQHPPLLPMTEDFGLPQQGTQIIFQSAQELPRTWFATEDGRRLLQAQADRLGYNWRRIDPDDEYPRHRVLLPEFETHYEALIEDLSESNPEIDVVELTYVNELRAPESVPAETHPRLGRFLRPLEGESYAFLPATEDGRYQARWRITEPNGQPVGRFYAAAEPVYRLDRVPVYLLTLTARLVSRDGSAASVIRLLNTAHTWIVEGFRDLTTEEMHRLWDLEEASKA